MPRLPARLVLIAACLAVGASLLHSQIRTGVEVVEVDVSVLDERRRPVRGLTAADFTVLEDGRAQEIVSFSAIDVPEAAPATSSWTRDIAPDVRTNLAAADRLLVMILDDAQVRSTPWHTTAVKSMGTSVVDRLGPNDLLAIVFTRDNRGAQPFTSDRSRLRAAIETFHGEFGGGDPDYFFMSSLKTLRYVAESLADAAARRKSLIYISPGVPLEGSSLEAFERRQEAQRIFEEARRANVNAYALDPSGFGGLDAEDPVPSAGRTQSRANDFLHALASNTGGRAVVNRNDVVGGINEVFDENASYYLVGYRSTSTAPANRFRRIDVRVKRPGVTVRARSGYTAARAEEAKTGDGPSAALVSALRDAAPKGHVAMQMTAAPFAVSGTKMPVVTMAIAFRQPRVTSGERISEHIDLLIGAYEPDGKRGPFERLNARVVLKPTDDPFVRYEVVTALQMRPGRYQLRVAAQSALLEKEGSVHYDLVVPDFSKGDVNVSGVLLTVEPNVPVAGRDRIAAIVPVVPTSRREFWAHDRVNAFVRIHRNMRGTDPVSVTTRLLNTENRTVFEKREALGVERLSKDRTADYQIAVPVAGLEPGAYLLKIEASGGRIPVERTVRITRR